MWFSWHLHTNCILNRHNQYSDFTHKVHLQNACSNIQEITKFDIKNHIICNE